MNFPGIIDHYVTETYYALLDTSNYWNENIYIDFQPDEIILKNISIYDADTTTTEANKTKMFLLKSNLVSDKNGVIATFPLAQAYHESYQLGFKNTRPIGGTYEFRVTAFDNTVPAGGGNFGMYVGVTLMYVKYKK
eukprot:Lithocolla_globosa_v1_NODE_11069_length_538_cov_120.681159.p1 type:complete len:136 gc:universal NODE_11069_length_538_cov_120.681159:511-104(-)